MSLYLSRIQLNPLYAPALKLAADPVALHRRILALLPCRQGSKPRTGLQPRTADVLFRVDETDSGPVVLIQSFEPPDWTRLEVAQRALRQPPETKLFEPAFRPGQRLAFRLLARPCKRRDGRRWDLRTDEERLAWLARKAELAGVKVESVGLTILSLPAIKGDRPRGQPGSTFAAVRFDGELLVAEPSRLEAAVRRGIGAQKAFGFGLLSLAPLRE